VRLRRRLTYELQALYYVQTAELDEAGFLDGATSSGAGSSVGLFLHGPSPTQQQGVPQGRVPSIRMLGDLKWGFSALERRCGMQGVVCVRRFFLALHFKAMLCSLCALLEGTFGWITGCAWTTAVSTVWFTLDMYPSLSVMVGNVLASLFFTACAVLWMLYVADDPFKYEDEQKIHRSAVERFFITNAMSFFVGWCWIVCMHDLITLAGAIFDVYSANWGLFGQVALVTCFGPLLTSLVVYVKMTLIRRYANTSQLEGEDESGGDLMPLQVASHMPENEALASQLASGSASIAPIPRRAAGIANAAPRLLFVPVVGASVDDTTIVSRRYDCGTTPDESILRHTHTSIN